MIFVQCKGITFTSSTGFGTIDVDAVKKTIRFNQVHFCVRAKAIRFYYILLQHLSNNNSSSKKSVLNFIICQNQVLSFLSSFRTIHYQCSTEVA